MTWHPSKKACECGCGELFQPSKHSPWQRFVNDTHRKRAARARDKAKFRQPDLWQQGARIEQAGEPS